MAGNDPYMDAIKTIEEELFRYNKGDRDKMTSLTDLYALHDDFLASEAEGDGGYRYDLELEIVTILKDLITRQAMKEHGYYQSDATGISRWYREPTD